MCGPIEEDDFSDLGPSTSGLQLPTGEGQRKSTNPDWNSDGSSDLEIVEVKEISSTKKQSIKLDVDSSEDEGFPQNPFKW